MQTVCRSAMSSGEGPKRPARKQVRRAAPWLRPSTFCALLGMPVESATLLDQLPRPDHADDTPPPPPPPAYRHLPHLHPPFWCFRPPPPAGGAGSHSLRAAACGGHRQHLDRCLEDTRCCAQLCTSPASQLGSPEPADRSRHICSYLLCRRAGAEGVPAAAGRAPQEGGVSVPLPLQGRQRVDEGHRLGRLLLLPLLCARHLVRWVLKEAHGMAGLLHRHRPGKRQVVAPPKPELLNNPAPASRCDTTFRIPAAPLPPPLPHLQPPRRRLHVPAPRAHRCGRGAAPHRLLSRHFWAGARPRLQGWAQEGCEGQGSGAARCPTRCLRTLLSCGGYCCGLQLLLWVFRRRCGLPTSCC